MTASNGIHTMPTFQEDSLAASVNNLSASLGSLSSSRHQSSQIAKTYRQAANLFLTRRLPEALSTIEPIIKPQETEVNGEESDLHTAAPIAAASRGSRIKVWSFYLTFLNSVVELGPEEGKHAFGTTKWKALVSRVRDGTVWEDVVRDGYHGIEGNVDADVVVNLATLLLTHSPSQKLNQARLETYLSSLAHPSFDITSHLSSPPRLRRAASSPGTNTPRDLHTNLKLLELYTLHVLPRNGEWDYAREFIMMSEVMDDERKEAFLQALHGLKEEQHVAAVRERDIQRAQQEQLEQQRKDEEEARLLEAKRAEEESRRREEMKRHPKQPEAAAREAVNRPKSSHGRGPSTSARPRPAPKKEVGRRTPPTSFYARATAVISTVQALVLGIPRNLRSNPMLLFRTILFLLVFALAFGRRDLRERVKRIVEQAWAKVRGTVGMGVKVSYI